MNNDHNGMQRAPQAGTWLTEGGRLRWVPAYEQVLEGDAGDFDDSRSVKEMDALDEEMWNSDFPPLPEGAPESARVRAMLAWLKRQFKEQRELAGELALIDQEQQRQREENGPPQRRRRKAEPPSDVALELARADGAADWLDLARATLLEMSDASSERALVEWYLWVVNETATSLTIVDPEIDPIVQARREGRVVIASRARQHAEQVSLPPGEDDE